MRRRFLFRLATRTGDSLAPFLAPFSRFFYFGTSAFDLVTRVAGSEESVPLPRSSSLSSPGSEHLHGLLSLALSHGQQEFSDFWWTVRFRPPPTKMRSEAREKATCSLGLRSSLKSYAFGFFGAFRDGQRSTAANSIPSPTSFSRYSGDFRTG